MALVACIAIIALTGGNGMQLQPRARLSPPPRGGAAALSSASAGQLLPPCAAELPLLSVAATAALAAGEHLLTRLGTAEVLATKLDRADLVTAVDGECQEIIEAHIRALDSGRHTMLGEESVPPGVDAAVGELRQLLSAAAARPDADGEEWLWIVDPIDGTTNFVSELPLCAVSIGIANARSGERAGAVVLDPFRAELFCAWRGRGAYLNGAPVRCAAAARLADAVVCGCSPKLHAVDAAVRGLAAVMPRARSVRVLGSGVLNFAWVACGRLAAYWEPELAPWDTAAGTLLVEEAGGVVTALDGAPFALETRAVIGGAPLIHAELLGVLIDAGATAADPEPPGRAAGPGGAGPAPSIWSDLA